jgi:hypothetical protein
MKDTMSELIKKKSFKGGTKKVPMKELELSKSVPSTGFKGTKSVPMKEMEMSKKVPKKDVGSIISLEVELQNSKKKPSKANAYDKEEGEFEVEKDEKGMWKETGEEKLKKLLKRRGK